MRDTNAPRLALDCAALQIKLQLRNVFRDQLTCQEGQASQIAGKAVLELVKEALAAKTPPR